MRPPRALDYSPQKPWIFEATHFVARDFWDFLFEVVFLVGSKLKTIDFWEGRHFHFNQFSFYYLFPESI